MHEYPYSDALMPRARWADLPLIDYQLTKNVDENFALLKLIDLVISSFDSREDDALLGLILDLSEKYMQRCSPMIGMSIAQLSSSGGIKAIFDATIECAERNMAITSPYRKDALHVLSKIGNISDEMRYDYLIESEKLDQPFSAFDLSNLFYDKGDIASYIEYATRAFKLGHIWAALVIIERVAMDKKLSKYSLLAHKAAKTLALNGIPVGMLDLALQSESHRYAMFLAAAEGNHQAVHIVWTDERFFVDPSISLIAKKLEASEDKRSISVIALRQAAARLLINKLLSQS